MQVLPLKWGNPSSQDSLIGPKGGQIRGSPLFTIKDFLSEGGIVFIQTLPVFHWWNAEYILSGGQCIHFWEKWGGGSSVMSSYFRKPR